MIPVALQLYSVRDDAKRDLADVIRRVAAMGYEGVEFAGFHEHAAVAVRRMLDDAGLRCAGSHVPLSRFEPDQLDQTLADHRAIGCEYLIIPSLPADRRTTREQCEATGRLLTALTQQVRDRGFRIGFHCHAQDVKPIDGGGNAWDLLAAATPEDFVLQYDTANGMDGGADPVAPLLAQPGRGATTHLKAYSKAGGHGSAVIGEDDVPWDRVLDACEQTAGTRWYIIEQEGHPSLPPMDAAERSLKGLRQVLAKRGGAS